MILEINALSPHLNLYYDEESNNIFIERKPTITGTVIIKKSLFNIFIGYDT